MLGVGLIEDRAGIFTAASTGPSHGWKLAVNHLDHLALNLVVVALIVGHRSTVVRHLCFGE
jgi:hypothetical protein